MPRLILYCLKKKINFNLLAEIKNLSHECKNGLLLAIAKCLFVYAKEAAGKITE